MNELKKGTRVTLTDKSWDDDGTPRPNRIGEHPVDRRVGVGDFMATLYRHLGIDAEHATIRDPQGRPVPLLQQDGVPIRELTTER